MKTNNKGFTAVEGVIIFIVIALIAGAGYVFYQRNKDSNKQATVEQPTVSQTGNNSTNLSYEEGIRLQPSTFGVAAGLPVADSSAVQLPDGTWRIYAFAQEQGIVSAISSDGLNFTAEPGSRMGDGAGMPRVVTLDDGSYRMFFISRGGIGSAISSNGLDFTEEPGLRVTPPAGVSEISGLSTPVMLSDGKWHAYFSELPRPGATVKPLHIYSATSSDMLTWQVDDGVRVGDGVVAASGEHPDAAVNEKGDVVLYFFVNNPQQLVTATSSDGITFTESKATGLDCNDPGLAKLSGQSYRIYCGLFDEKVGGIVKSALGDLPQ